LDGLALPVARTDSALELPYLPAVFGDLALLLVLALLLKHVGGGTGPAEAGGASKGVGAELAGLFEVLEAQALLSRKTCDEGAETLAAGLLFFLLGDGRTVWKDSSDAPRRSAGWAGHIGACVVEDSQD
jgi:hypothetical protein